MGAAAVGIQASGPLKVSPLGVSQSRRRANRPRPPQRPGPPAPRTPRPSPIAARIGPCLPHGPQLRRLGPEPACAKNHRETRPLRLSAPGNLSQSGSPPPASQQQRLPAALRVEASGVEPRGKRQRRDHAGTETPTAHRRTHSARARGNCGQGWVGGAEGRPGSSRTFHVEHGLRSY